MIPNAAIATLGITRELTKMFAAGIPEGVYFYPVGKVRPPTVHPPYVDLRIGGPYFDGMNAICDITVTASALCYFSTTDQALYGAMTLAGEVAQVAATGFYVPELEQCFPCIDVRIKHRGEVQLDVATQLVTVDAQYRVSIL